MPTCHTHNVKYATYGNCSECIKAEQVATAELLRIYGWKQAESLQMFLHRTRAADPLKHSPEYMTKLLQDCESELEKAKEEIIRLRDYIDHAQRTLNAALSASENIPDETTPDLTTQDHE